MINKKSCTLALLLVIIFATVFMMIKLNDRRDNAVAKEASVSRETKVIILHTKEPVSPSPEIPEVTVFSIPFTPRPLHTAKNEITMISETATPVLTEIPEITEMPEVTPEPTEYEIEVDISRSDDGWLPYLATSYSAKPGSVGNRGESLDGKKVIAMWQTDMNYARLYTNMVEPFKSFFKRTDGVEYGSLPYGTEVEMRIWTGSDYKYLGVYKVLDDSPTTQYNLSNVAVNLHGNKSPLYFNFTWTDTNYRGEPAKGGERKGQITNWKADYNYNVKGWLDVLDAGWGMVIVEIKML
jgi:hypothetical protein